MNRFLRLPFWVENWPIVVIGITGIPLFLALVIEHLAGLVPCALCLMQRVWMIAAGLIALVAWMVTSTHAANNRLYPALSATMAGIGAGFSIRHLYLQTLPEHEAPSCGPDVDYMLENFPLADVLLVMTRGTGDCAKVTSIVDVLIPVGALVIFLLVIALCAVRTVRR